MAHSLSSIVEHAIKHVPRYKSFKAFEEFPIVSKWEMIGDLPHHVSNQIGEEKGRLISYLHDESTIVPNQPETVYSSHIIVEETSGSSGIPFRVPKTIGERTEGAIEIWKYRRQYDPELSCDKFHPFIHEPIGFRRLINPFVITRENIDNLYRHLTADGIRWVHGTPEVLLGHAKVLSPERIADKTIRFVENTGYHMTDEARRFIEEHLKVSVVDQYGCREVWAIGSRLGGGAFRIVSKNVFVELLDPDGNPIREVGQPGRIVVTSLYQRLFPFIRYDTGDIGEWAAEPIGSHLYLAKDRRAHMMKIGAMEVSGNDVFKKLLVLIYRDIGRINVRYLQIRQLSLTCFAVVTDISPEAERLRVALEQSCMATKRFPYRVIFVSRQLNDVEIERELRKKPTLFTSRPMLDRRDSFDL